MRVCVALSCAALILVTSGYPLKQDESKRGHRVSTNAILALEKQLKNMAGEHDTPPDETPAAEDGNDKLSQEEDSKMEDADNTAGNDVEKAEEGLSKTDVTDEELDPVPQEVQVPETHSEEPSENSQDVPSLDETDDEEEEKEAALFAQFLQAAEQHPQILGLSLDEFLNVMDNLEQEDEQSRQEGGNEDNQRDENSESGPSVVTSNYLGGIPDAKLEQIQASQGDANAKVVAKKRVIPPVNVLRRRMENQNPELGGTGAQGMRKREPETVNKKNSVLQLSKRD